MGTRAGSKFLHSLPTAQLISTADFVNALFSTWWGSKGRHERGKNFFALAVSGGVDSMALATLCSRIQKSRDETFLSKIPSEHAQAATDMLRNINFHAFIVDHSAREGSDIEAQAVSRVLEDRGISTTVRKIRWANHQIPASLPNFESVARRHRFQELGKACKEKGIDSLLLAHHEDDQLETVMMRLIAGHRTAGLRGMYPSSEIPECYGMHGIHESGGVDSIAESTSHSLGVTVPPVPYTTAQSQQGPRSPMILESGGIKIYRPLLNFSKDCLIATCRADGMEWFEDQTNKDPTVTMRNSIRYMYSSHAMPAALSKPAILELSKSLQARQDFLSGLAKSRFALCHPRKFQPRSGTLTIRFLDLKISKLSMKQDQQIAVLLLQQVLTYVTPKEHWDLKTLARATKRLFPEIFFSLRDAPRPTRFSTDGVLFSPRISTIHGEKCEWLLSRQPYGSTVDRPPRFTISPCHSDQVETPWSEWTLWDGRYWFRAQNLSLNSVHLCPLSKEDMAGFKQSLSAPIREKLGTLLKELAPGDVRWSLPAIVAQDINGQEKVLALPTFDIGVSGVEKLVRWEVRYKKVDANIMPVVGG